MRRPIVDRVPRGSLQPPEDRPLIGVLGLVRKDKGLQRIPLVDNGVPHGEGCLWTVPP
jgi:hypothetical protein